MAFGGRFVMQKECRNNNCLEGWIWKQMGEFPDGPCPDCCGEGEAENQVGPSRLMSLLRRVLRR